MNKGQFPKSNKTISGIDLPKIDRMLISNTDKKKRKNKEMKDKKTKITNMYLISLPQVQVQGASWPASCAPGAEPAVLTQAWRQQEDFIPHIKRTVCWCKNSRPHFVYFPRRPE